MQTLTRGRYRATLKPTRNVGEFSALLDKCNGKHKPSKIKGETRKYPAFEAGMSTQRYVRLYENMQRGMVAGLPSRVRTATHRRTHSGCMRSGWKNSARSCRR